MQLVNGICAGTDFIPNEESKRYTDICLRRWRIEPEYAIKVDPSLGILGVLLEPTTVVTKALEQIGMISRRSFWEPNRVLVTGAGPIGLLAALSLKIWGVEEIHVLDRMESGSKPDLVRELGAIYHSGSVSDIGFEPDAIVECTGVGPVIEGCIQQLGANGILCLTGVGHGGTYDKGRNCRYGSCCSIEEYMLSSEVSMQISASGTGQDRPWPKLTGNGFQNSSPEEKNLRIL